MKKNKQETSLGAGLIVLSSFFYASYGIWTRLTGDFIGGYPATAIRSVLVVAILTPIAIHFKQLEKLNIKGNWRALIGLTLSSALIWGPLYYAILNAGIGVSIAVHYAAIVIGMFLFGWLLFGEKFTKNKLLSAILGFVGLGVIFIPGNAQFGLLALSAAALSGLAVSLNMILSKKLTYNPTQSTIMLWTTGIVANLFMMLIIGEKLPSLTWNITWLYLVIFAVASVIASWSFVSGLRRLDAGIAGILGLLEVIFGILFGIILFNEQPGLWVYIGAAVILLAAAVPYLKGFNLKRGHLE